MRKFMLILALLLVSVQLHAQEWACRVIDGDAGYGSGSVVMVSPTVDKAGHREALILTANHVCGRSSGISVEFKGKGRFEDAKVVVRDAFHDTMVIIAKIDGEIKPVPIAERYAVEGDKISFVGKNYRTFDGTASPLSFNDRIWIDAVVIPGDSGGAVLLDGCLIGVVSGGLEWTPSGPQRTWPCRASNLNAVSNLMELASRDVSWVPTAPLKIKRYAKGDAYVEGVQLFVFGAEWCGPCKRLKADLPSVMGRLDKLGVDRLVWVDIDRHADVARQYKVTMIPTIVVLVDGKEVGRGYGTGTEGFMDMIEKSLKGKE